MSVPGASQFAKSLAFSAGECPLAADICLLAADVCPLTAGVCPSTANGSCSGSKMYLYTANARTGSVAISCPPLTNKCEHLSIGIWPHCIFYPSHKKEERNSSQDFGAVVKPPEPPPRGNVDSVVDIEPTPVRIGKTISLLKDEDCDCNGYRSCDADNRGKHKAPTNIDVGIVAGTGPRTRCRYDLDTAPLSQRP